MQGQQSGQFWKSSTAPPRPPLAQRREQSLGAITRGLARQLLEHNKKERLARIGCQTWLMSTPCAHRLNIQKRKQTNAMF